MTTPVSLVGVFDDLPDPRGVHAAGCRGEAYVMKNLGRSREEWLRTFLPLPEGFNSHDTSDRLDRGIRRGQHHAAMNPAYPHRLLEIGCLGRGSRSRPRLPPGAASSAGPGIGGEDLDQRIDLAAR